MDYQIQSRCLDTLVDWHYPCPGAFVAGTYVGVNFTLSLIFQLALRSVIGASMVGID